MLKSRGLANRLKLYPTLSLTVFFSLLKTLAHLEQGELKTTIQKKKKTSDDGLRKYRMQSQLVQIYKGL